MMLLPKGCKELVNVLTDFRLDRKRRGRTDILDALADAVKLSEATLAPLQRVPRTSSGPAPPIPSGN